MFNSLLIRTEQFIFDIRPFVYIFSSATLSRGNIFEKESHDDILDDFVIKDNKKPFVSSALLRYSRQEVRSWSMT